MRSDNQGKCKKEDLLLYAVTDRSWLNGETLYAQVEKALKGGVTLYSSEKKIWTRHHFSKRRKKFRSCAHSTMYHS